MRFLGAWARRFPFLILAALPLAAGCGGGGGGDAPDGGASDGAATEEDVPLAEQGTYLNIVVPSVVKPEEDMRLRLRVVTQVGLPDYDFDGVFRIEGRGNVEFPDPMTLDPDPDGFYETNGIRFRDPGVQFLRGVVPGDTVQALANPVNVARDPEYRVYWGDLNGHTDLSSGNRAPGVYYWYAKAVALLDFVALTDNDAWEDRVLDDETFEEIAERALGEAEVEGQFVGIPAFEWTSARYGNRLVYFPGIPPQLPTVASGVDTPAKLREALPAGAVVAVAHPSGSKTSHPADPASVGEEDLVEIYSALGIFEKAGTHRASTQEKAGSFVIDLLRAGKTPGFIANGDSRLTTPGNPRAFAYGDFPYGGGLTAVLAKELTRAAVLDALREGRCYGTTGRRYLLEFTVDGKPMGSHLKVPSGHEATIYGSLGSTTNWVRLEIVGPKGPIAVLTPEPGRSDVVELPAKTPPVTQPTFVYLRGVDEFGGMAWSSPVYLAPQ
ncbi:hypothetical protein K8I85_05300 [bacterium]|nr:hypothetical protein [bacterium]